MASATKMDVVENDSIRKPKTYVETNRKFKRLTLVNNNNNDGKIGLEILLISDRSLLGTNTTGGDDDDDFAFDGKKNEETESESDEEEDESGSDVSSSKDDSEDHEREEGAKEGLKTAACAVEVSVGYLSDPENFHGLSHFLEHMVFMGTRTNRSENFFDEWLSRNWGSQNAYTDTEKTVFHFDVHPKRLKEGVEIFSKFFTEPLILERALEREVTAIESEFERVVNSDGVRMELLLADLAIEGHPYRKFGWGNRQSLTESEAYKEKNGARKALKRHFKEHYHARRMSVVVCGAEELEELEEMVLSAKAFGSLCVQEEEEKEEVDDGNDDDTNNKIVDEYVSQFERIDEVNLSDTYGQPFAHLVPSFVKTSQVKTGTQLTLVFQLSSKINRNYLSKSVNFIETLLGHEGEGSCFEALRKRGLCSELCAGVSRGGLDDTSISALLSVSIKLTERGATRTEDILFILFTYLRQIESLLSSNGARFYDEMQQISQIEFEYSESEHACEFVERLVSDVRRFSPENVLYGDSYWQRYDENEIREVLSMLTPENVLVILASSEYKGNDAATIEPWVKFPYEVESFKYTASTSDAQDMQKVEKELGFPSKNRFIPKDLRMHNEIEKLFPVKGNDSINNTTTTTTTTNHVTLEVTPKIIYNECGVLRLWAKLGCREFKTQPKASMYFNANLLVEESVHDTMCLKMFALMLQDSVNKDIYYPAHVAANECSVHVLAQSTGVSFRFDGWSDTISELALAYFRRAASADQSFIQEEDRFQKVKEMALQDMQNMVLKVRSHCAILSRLMKHEKEHSLQEKVAVLKEVTSEDVIRYGKKFFQNVFTEGLLVGNITESMATKLGDSLKQLLVNAAATTAGASENTSGEEVTRGNNNNNNALVFSRVVNLPPGTNHSIHVNAVNKDEVNSAITHYYQIGPSNSASRAIALLCEQFMSEKIFDQLRTKESLGYVVSAYFESSNEILGFNVLVESAFHAPKFVSERIKCFLDAFPSVIENLTDEEFNKQRVSLMEELLAEDANLREQSGRYFAHLKNRKYQFHRARDVAGHVSTITKADIARFCRETFSDSSTNASDGDARSKQLSVSIHGKNYPVEEKEKSEVKEIIAIKGEYGYYATEEGDGVTVPELYIPSKKIANAHSMDVAISGASHANPDTTAMNEDTIDAQEEGTKQQQQQQQFYSSKVMKTCETPFCGFCGNGKRKMPFSLPSGN